MKDTHTLRDGELLAELEATRRRCAELERAVVEAGQIEADLRRKTGVLAAMTDASPLGFLVVDNRTDEILYFNHPFVEIWGIEALEEGMRRGELRNKDIIPYCIPRVLDVPAFAASCEPLQSEENRAVVEDEIAFVEDRTIRRFSTQIRDEQDRYFGRLYIFEDITLRKRARDSLRESGSRFKSLYSMLRLMCDNVPDLIWAKDMERRFVFVNKAMCEKLLGAVDTSEPIGKNDMYFAERARNAHPDDPHWHTFGEICVDSDSIVIETMQPQRFDEYGNVKGEFMFLDVYKAPFLDEHGAMIGTVGCGRDVTRERQLEREQRQAEEERRKLELQMQQVQKLESLGVLAGGIAHDFNNLLTAILGNIDMTLHSLPPASPLGEGLIAAERAVNRAADLTRQMLAYSGRGRFIVSEIDLSALVEEMTQMLRVSISKKARLKLNLAPALPYVQADASQLRQVVMNLVINASEAIGDADGEIAITTGSAYCDRDSLSESWLDEQLPAGDYVFLTIADSGCGMDAETQARVFDPFFSTKFTGRGLGLAAVLGIVRGHKGAIKIQSEPGKGSTFMVLFPASSRPVDQPDDRHETRPVPRGSEVILVVDDEEDVRETARDLLQYLGYTVLTAGDGQAALEIFRTHPDDVSCILLDLTMPRMDGEETFRELRRIKPDVCVLMSSGYGEQEVLKRFAGQGISGFIEKPYHISTLAAKMAELVACKGVS